MVKFGPTLFLIFFFLFTQYTRMAEHNTECKKMNDNQKKNQNIHLYKNN